jgi:putative FmdB family regulatory protein
MPLYEYQCDACGHRFEKIQKFSDAPLSECPECGGPVQKLLSSPAIQFKGSGWYITDYARAGGKDKAQPDASPAKAAEGGDTGKADKSKSDAPAPASGATAPESKPAAPAAGKE